MKAHRILVAEDNPALREMMTLSLRKEGYDVTVAASAGDLSRCLAQREFDLIVSDIYLGDAVAIDLLPEIRSTNPGSKTILITAQGTVETVAAARVAGVFEYLAKPFTLDVLVDTVAAALEARRTPPSAPSDGPESMIIGSDPSIVEVYKSVARVAPLQVPVLIRGETGTGKELVARALHRFSRRAEGPFVAVNCGAIPESLLESELFGHRKGSFTGAHRDHQGFIEQAKGGTILFDEVGDLPPMLQVKLLRFLQGGELHPVGAGKGITVPVRVLAATHRDLRKGIETGHFREDFFYRLAGYEIEIPPLRERSADIPALAEFFLEKYARAHDTPTTPTAIDPGVMEALRNYPWPGNVRELENVVQRALIDLGGLHAGVDLNPYLEHLSGPSPAPESTSAADSVGDEITLEELERRHIVATLRRWKGNRTRAAATLGIERKSLYRKAKRLGIELDSCEEDP